MAPLHYLHVDVFSSAPYGGNSLPVFYNCPELSAQSLLQITRELRHFEAIFLQPDLPARKTAARVFDLMEELPFAGHPLIGAAAVLHHLSGAGTRETWSFDLAGRGAAVEVERREAGYFGVLDQGQPRFLGVVEARAAIAQAFALGPDDLESNLPLEVVSTGLRYLIVPLLPERIGLARIASDITGLLAAHGAQFAVLLDVSTLEIRHWNNDGVIEDVATGSAAGVVGAYVWKHGLAGPRFCLAQGRFAGRPSRLEVHAEAAHGEIRVVKVGGPVAILGQGQLDRLPELSP